MARLRWRHGFDALVRLLYTFALPALGLVVPAPALSAVNEYLDLPLDALLAVEIPRISGATGFEQSAADAPSAVTVISAEDIRRYGYRTLVEALSSERGFYATDNLNYQFLGMRGFNQPGDYNSRFLVLIDGTRMSEPVYGSAPLGLEFPLDMDLVERIEIMRGAGSSLYGGNATLGVINVITRRGGAYAGLRVSGSTGSFDTRGGRVSFGKLTDGGTDVLASISGLRTDGPSSLVFPEVAGDPAFGGGVLHGMNAEKSRNLFLSVSHGDFRFIAADGVRDKQFGHGSWATVFGDPRSFTRDAWQTLSLQYRRVLDDTRSVSARLYRGHYRYDADYATDYPPVLVNRDLAAATWWGAEVRVDHVVDRHRLSYGADLTTTQNAMMVNFDRDPSGAYSGCQSIPQERPCVDRRVAGGGVAAYLQDDISFSPNWRLNAVVRHDRLRDMNGVTSPRLGLIYSPRQGTAIKLIVGHSFRAPGLYDRYSAYDGYSTDSLGLRAEKVRNTELIVEHSFLPNLRMLATLFRYHYTGLAEARTDGNGLVFYENGGGLHAKGGELELQGRLSWIEARGSVAVYHAETDGTKVDLSSSPHVLAKLRLGVPWRDDRFHAGTELQHVSSARAANTTTTPGRTLVNLVLTARDVQPGLDLSAGLYNLFDRRYGDPATSGDHLAINQLPQPGRTFRVKADYRF
jgi:outer membrane receptor protein involved in Fe transport